jgi:RNA polymerase sigma factor (sigma-70 family)
MTPQALLAPARLAGQPILRSQSDERLVDLVRAGYDPAFEAIVARYRRAILRYCSRVLTAERAEDAVQHTFVKAYDAMRSNEAELNLRPWLYRIAHNTSLNVLRDRGLQHEQLTEQMDGVERPDQAMERRQGIRDVLAAVQALPERQRDAIVLRELEGRSYEEIAGALGVTGGAVRQLLNRARTTLRAGASAVTPTGLITRLPLGGHGDSLTSRVAETLGGAGTGAIAAKLCATALVTGAVVGGVAVAPHHPGTRSDDAVAKQAAGDTGSGSRSADGSGRSAGGSAGDRGAGERDLSESGSDRGHGGGQEGSDDGPGSRSGPSGGDDSDGHSGTGHSGPGGSGDDSHSGPSGSDDSHSGESGSGESNSGPGSDDSGSGEHSGSGESGSGSGESGSGSDSGSSSGPGSGDSTETDSSGPGSGSTETGTTEPDGDPIITDPPSDGSDGHH